MDKPKATLDEKAIRGHAEKGSQMEKILVQEYAEAQKALQEVDAQKLFLLYEKLIERRNEILGAMEVIVNMYVGKEGEFRAAYIGSPDKAPSADVIKAMQTVTLAAMDLAKQYMSIKK